MPSAGLLAPCQRVFQVVCQPQEGRQPGGPARTPVSSTRASSAALSAALVLPDRGRMAGLPGLPGCLVRPINTDEQLPFRVMTQPHVHSISLHQVTAHVSAGPASLAATARWTSQVLAPRRATGRRYRPDNPLPHSLLPIVACVISLSLATRIHRARPPCVALFIPHSLPFLPPFTPSPSPQSRHGHWVPAGAGVPHGRPLCLQAWQRGCCRRCCQ